jgi:hypothetical protein
LVCGVVPALDMGGESGFFADLEIWSHSYDLPKNPTVKEVIDIALRYKPIHLYRLNLHPLLLGSN